MRNHSGLKYKLPGPSPLFRIWSLCAPLTAKWRHSRSVRAARLADDQQGRCRRLSRPQAAVVLHENTVSVMFSPHGHSTAALAPARQATASAGAAAPAPAARLLAQWRESMRCLHDSIRTEEACVHWERACIRFHGLRRPKLMGPDQVQAFVSGLANELNRSGLPDQHAKCRCLPWM